MKLSCAFSFAFLSAALSFGAGSVYSESDDSGYAQRRETLAREAVAKDPKSEDARLQLANVLSDLRRDKEARAEVEEVLRLNPSNSAAKAFLRNIDIQHSNLSDREKGAALLKNLSEQLEPMKNLAGSLPPELQKEQDERIKALDARYGISQYKFPPVQYHKRSARQGLIQDLRLEGKNEQAADLLREELSELPDSAETRLEYAEMLIRLNRFAEAKEVLDAGILKYPAHPLFLILLDGMKEIQAASSTELASTARQELSMRMLDASTIRTRTLLKKQ